MAKKKMGRPTSYKPEYCQEIVEFFSCRPYEVTKDFKHGRIEIPNEFPTMIKFAMKINVDVTTLQEWAKVYPDFSRSYNKSKKLQEQFISENSLRGNYNAPFAIFMMKNVAKWRDEEDQSWSDKTELTGLNGGAVQVTWSELAKEAKKK